MKTDFLYKEYEECFNQLRFYDDRQLTLLKFSITISSSIGAAILAIYKLFDVVTNSFWLVLFFISMLVWVGIMMLFWTMIQNRLYYIYPTRQVNAIRNFFIINELQEFAGHNQMYVSTDFSAFKWLSTQTLMIGGISLLDSAYLIIGVFALCKYSQQSFNVCTFTALIVGAFFFIGNTFIGGKYLSCKGKKSADNAVHKI